MTGIVFSPPRRDPASVVLLGGGFLAAPIVHRLTAAGHPVIRVGRRAEDGASSSEIVPTEDLRDGAWRLPADAIVVSLAPLWSLEPLLAGLASAQRIIAFGSTTLFTKADSDTLLGGDRAAALERGERTLTDFCGAKGVSWTILRPTLIYDPPRDGTITELARAIRRWVVLPLAGRARGLRQPVHAEDLAEAVLSVIRSGATYDRAFNLGGGEVLSFRAMAARVARAIGRPPLFLPVPPRLLAGASTRLVDGRDRARGFSQGAIEHMNQDMVFDNAPAALAFGYRPRAFEPVFPKDFR